MRKGLTKKVISVLLAVIMIFSLLTVAFVSFAANGDWVEAEFEETIGYEALAAGKYYFVDGNYALGYSSNSLSATNISNGFGSATEWTLSKSSDGSFRFTSPSGITSGGSSQFFITAVSQNSVYVQDYSGNYLRYNSSTSKFAFSSTPNEIKVYTHTPGQEAKNNYVYQLDTDGIDVGAEYILAGRANAYALSFNGTDFKAYSINNYRSNQMAGVSNTLYKTITIPKDKINGENHHWVFSSKTSGSIKWNNGNYYLRTNSSSIGTVTSSSNSSFTITESNLSQGNYSFKYTRYGTTRYLTTDSNGNFSYSTDSNTLWLYKLTEEPVDGIPETYDLKTFAVDPNNTIKTPVKWARLDAGCTVTDIKGTTAEEVEYAIRSSEAFRVCTSESEDGYSPIEINNNDSKISFNFTSVNFNTAGTYNVPVNYNSNQIGTVQLNLLSSRPVRSAEIIDTEGTVLVDSESDTLTGAYLRVEYEDGSIETKAISLSMLSGNFDINSIDMYQNLTVTFNGITVANDFTLNVIGKNDYPEYPEEGSVKVNKTGSATDFATNGVAKVELSATGVPMAPGIDIVMVLDTSSSMGSYMGTYNGREVFCEGTSSSSRWFYTDLTSTGLTGSTNSRVTNKKSRHDVLQESLNTLVTALNAEGTTGKSRDIQLAICDFNGYTQIDKTNDRLKNVSVISTTTDYSQVYTGDKKWDAGAFVSIDSLVNNIPTLASRSGTNYDRAFEEAYTLIKAKKEANEANDEVRQQYVIFMSDGGAFQFNYITGNSQQVSGASYNDWNDWLMGTYNDYTEVPVYNSTTHGYFYNGKGNPNRFAEAIKGDPEQQYTIIDRNKATGTVDVTGDGRADAYMHNVAGLGAKLYSIGYCICPDMNLTAEAIKAALTHSATSEEYYYDASSATQLLTAFDAILADLKQAGTEAYFVDKIGSCYDIQLAGEYTKNGVDYRLNPAPKIEFIDYDLFTHTDYMNGIINDYNLIGTRKGTYTVKESVTFNASGTEAYSNKIGGNLMRDGVIYAQTFTFNGTQEPKDIDTDGDGINDYTLDAESFYWKIGIVAELEHVLSYNVYLTGSMEGTRPAGTYPTNEYATLYYTNYLGHPCHKDTVSPRLPWEAANISYEFYLVNADGKPVNTAGEIVPFSNRVLVGNAQTKEVLLNNTVETDAAISAADVIPEGYILYSPDSNYVLKIDSGATPSSATINDTKTTNDNTTVTTFFYDVGGTYNRNGLVPNVTDYGNTHVAFAVLLTPTVIPDAVVIDYGIPVKISALANDLSIPTGTNISAISKTIPSGLTLNTQSYSSSQFASSAKSLTYDHGNVTVSGNTVVYTPTDAEMDAEDIIYYEVILNGKYYYSKITVYPAQNIYYEDDFFTFSPESSWKTAGTRKENAYQAEDRPGEFNLSSIDFNNVYGYDAVYDDTTVTYSLGSARYVNVTPSTPQEGASQPKASFRFRGTGFDLFSVTSNETGFTYVQVYDTSGNLVENYSVQTYYGYSYDAEENRFSADTGASGGIYQIPIIRSRGLTYGTYDVVVTPMYSSWMDHQKAGDYDLYIDGVRIYDPAGIAPSDSISSVYEQDTEAETRYIELRSNIISANDFYKLSTLPDGMSGYGNTFPGVMFIDSISSLSDSIEESYRKFAQAGPNNELYLSKGQAIAFYLQLDGCHEVPATIQLGMKVVGGDANGNVLVMNSAQSAPEKISVQGGSARYHSITNAFTWNQDLLGTKTRTGLAATPTAAFGADTVTGDYSSEEWTLNQSSGGWYLCNSSGSRVTLTRTESSGITASFAPGGTGDSFTVSAENGLFSFANSSDISFGYNGVITGADYDRASFFIYKKGEEENSYIRIKTVEEIEDGGKYVLVYDGAADMLVSPVTTSVTSDSTSYRTLYPIVIMNNSNNIVALTNFKVAFKTFSGEINPTMRLLSDKNSTDFAEDAVSSFILAADDKNEVDTSGITTEYVVNEGDSNASGTLYIRTSDDIVKVAVGDDEVTRYTDNGDGTRTFAYDFGVDYDSSTGTYTVTVTDKDGNTGKIVKTGEYESELKVLAKKQRDDVEDGGNVLIRIFKRLIQLIVDYFKSIVRW